MYLPHLKGASSAI